MAIIGFILGKFVAVIAVAASIWWFVPGAKLRTIFREESLPRALGAWAILTIISLPIGSVVVICVSRLLFAGGS